MFGSIDRLVRCQKSVASLVRWKATRLPKVADITNAQFWEEDTRPIPNVSDSVVHVVTQDNEHINWERSHHKVKLVGVVQNAAKWMNIGVGRAIHFTLDTTTVVEQEEGYMLLNDSHHILVMQETVRKLALKYLRPGVAVIVVGGIHYRMHSPQRGFNTLILPHLYLEQFHILTGGKFKEHKFF